MARYSKFIVAALAFAGVVASSGLLSGQAQAWANCVIAAVGAALVYLVPNVQVPAAPKRRATKKTEAGALTTLEGIGLGCLVVLVLILLAALGVIR